MGNRNYLLISGDYPRLIRWSVTGTMLGICISALFFGQQLLLAATGLTALFLIRPMSALLNENRDAIWLQQRSPWEANSTLTLKIMILFLSVFLTTIASQWIAPGAVRVPLASGSPLFSNQPLPLFLHNLRVLLAALLLATIYRSAGLLLVICWNAISWSVSIIAFMHDARAAGLVHFWLYGLSVVPHLVLESAAYVMAGLSGVFLSKGMFKYKLSSRKFFRVSRACVVILAIAVALLWLAMRLEIDLAQALLTGLSRHQ